MRTRMTGVLFVVLLVGLMAGCTQSSVTGGSTANQAGSLRTPWGQPDLQGVWSPGYYLTPLQRPDKYGEREFLTDEEIVALEKEQTETKGRDTRLEQGSREDLEGAYNDAFSGRGDKVIRTKRTSLIIDPKDGKVPPLTAVAKAREDERRARAEATGRLDPRFAKVGYLVPPPDGGYYSDNPEDRVPDRCIGITLPFLKGTSGGFTRIAQAPESVVIYQEDGHVGGAYRMVYVDGRKHQPANVRLWLGDSIGRWEGDTLVVDTTNFTDRTDFHGSGENLHLTERFTRAGADMIKYDVTAEDSTTWARPWTIELPLTKYDDSQIYESACHEGNYAMTTVLAGARARERKAGGAR